jgi:two-component system response regulator BaeR
MLPEKDGMTICREIRQFSHVPIIMVTAKVEEIDRLLGLELGADDYVCKPFSPREVVARVKAQLRRVDMLTASTIPAPAEHEHFKLDENKLEVTLAGGTVSLTAIEMAILSAMYEREGCVFSRDKLIDGIYADHRVVSDRTIDSHIKKLRKKLQQADTDHTFIQSVYGVGYRFVMPD